MITHTYPGTKFLSSTEQRIPGLPGWFVTGRTEHGGFAILAKEANLTGFKTRSVAREVKRQQGKNEAV